MADGSHLKNREYRRCLKNRLTDFDEIWSADAYWLSKSYMGKKNILQLKIRWAVAHRYFENEKSPFILLNFQKKQNKLVKQPVKI